MKPFITLDTSEVKQYIAHLQKLDYKEMNNGIISLVRQTANDIKRIYMPLTPIRTKGTASGKYGAMPGNLRRSLRVYQKRQRDAFVVEFSVGFNFPSEGKKKAAGAKGKYLNDGYYSYYLNTGTAGSREKKVRRVDNNTGFVDRARDLANRQINQGLSERGKMFITRKLNKMLKNG